LACSSTPELDLDRPGGGEAPTAETGKFALHFIDKQSGELREIPPISEPYETTSAAGPTNETGSGSNHPEALGGSTRKPLSIGVSQDGGRPFPVQEFAFLYAAAKQCGIGSGDPNLPYISDNISLNQQPWSRVGNPGDMLPLLRGRTPGTIAAYGA
jgi:hypothetical protein